MRSLTVEVMRSRREPRKENAFDVAEPIRPLRLDGWPARDLNAGAIIASAPTMKPFTHLLSTDEATVRKVLMSWRRGNLDAELILNGEAFGPDGEPAATLLPAAFGLAGSSRHTYTGWGGIAHWNAFVANLEMAGSGTFWDPRLNEASKFPIAARQRPGSAIAVRRRTLSRRSWQLFMPIKLRFQRPNWSETRSMAGQQTVWRCLPEKAQCATCHVPPLYTEPGWNTHTPEEIGMMLSRRSVHPTQIPDDTACWMMAKQKGGFYHDGRFATLVDVMDHYDRHFNLRLSAEEKRDLAAFAGSL